MPSRAQHSVDQSERWADVARYTVPLGRLLFSLIFLASAPMHFTSQGIGYAAAYGVPSAEVLVPLSGVLLLLGGLGILFGYHARIAALLLVLFLVPVTLMMHNFWAIADAAEAQTQQIMFMKNLSMLGAALLFVYFGSGPFSLDSKRAKRHGKLGEQR
jgi:putative oxidoreductase